jgi:formylglycine-generating enzyme required for sulfatase activity
MKSCSFCNSEFLPFEGGGPARCWLCGGDTFVDVAEEEIQKRRKRKEKKELCCPNQACPPQLRPRAERHCSRCGAPLKEATIELWLEKCVKPWRMEGGLEPLIEAAWLMGFSKEKAEERLNEYIENEYDERSSGLLDDRHEAETLESRTLTIGISSADEPPVSVTGKTILEPYAQEIGRAESKKRHRIALICLLLFVSVALFLWLKDRLQNGRGASLDAPQTSTVTSASPSIQPEVPTGMTYIPGGEFMMGRELKDGGDEYESPSFPVNVQPFFIDTYEVTREAYRKCVEVKQCPVPEGWSDGTYPPGTGRWPVTGINWDTAQAYTKWAGKRLPTEEEWEFAAKGSEGRRYPWGNEWQQGLANANGVRNEPANVGEYKGASPFKVFDMVGNAWEWTASDFKIYGAGDAKHALVSSGEKVIRGGYWGSRAAKATTTFRTGWRARGEADYSNTGFRCAMNAPNNSTR